MYARNYDASVLTQRLQQRSSTIFRPSGQAQGSRDSSTQLLSRLGRTPSITATATAVTVQNAVGCGGALGIKTLPTICVAGSPPGPVADIFYTAGSIVVSWVPPSTGNGPYEYEVVCYTAAGAGAKEVTRVRTARTTYRFAAELTEGLGYTFTVCAWNAAGGAGPVMTPATVMMAPPTELSAVVSCHPEARVESPDAPLGYVLVLALDGLLEEWTRTGIGPTRTARLLYLWAATIAQAWNWVTPAAVESYVVGVVDGWDWTGARGPLAVMTDTDRVIWMCGVLDTVGPYMVSVGCPYRSPFPCDPARAAAVRARGGWDAWVARWRAWWSVRAQDGSDAATTTQPTDSANWGQALVVDGITVNPIAAYPQPRQWTRLRIGNEQPQKYLTYLWGTVASTCLTAAQEATVAATVQPAVGAARDAEIDEVLAMSQALTDEQKMTAEFWAGGPGTPSPPPLMAWLWKEYVRCLCVRRRVTCATMVWSLLDLAVHLFEGSRVTWGLKRAWMEARPIQEIRRRYAATQMMSWSGQLIDGAQWMPYQTATFVTPPFADFPSGHSHFSKAFALVMTRWFGADIVPYPVPSVDRVQLMSPVFSVGAALGGGGGMSAYGVFSFAAGSSEVQPGVVPARPLTLSFPTWESVATSSGMSRLYGGIHARTAHTASQTTALLLDGMIAAAWDIRLRAAVPLPLLVTPSVSDVVPVDPVMNSSVVKGEAPVSVASLPSMPLESVSVAPVVPVAPVMNPSVAPVVPVMNPSVVPVVPYVIQTVYLTAGVSATVKATVEEACRFLESIVVQTHGYRDAGVSLEADMVVEVQVAPLGAGVLANSIMTAANERVPAGMLPVPLRQQITLNSTTPDMLATATLNGRVVLRLLPVLIHEMLHGLGLGCATISGFAVGWDSMLDPDTRSWYLGGAVGSVAVAAYREIAGPTVDRIPVENSFGAGTAGSHWEEGVSVLSYDPNGAAVVVKEDRMWNGVFHPAIPNEILSGVAGSTFLFTAMTAGALVDRGYVVDMSSANVVPMSALQGQVEPQ